MYCGGGGGGGGGENNYGHEQHEVYPYRGSAYTLADVAVLHHDPGRLDTLWCVSNSPVLYSHCRHRLT